MHRPLDAQANGISVAVSGGGLLKGVGRWLDRGINRLIGGDSGAASGASSDDEFEASAPSHRRRATADVARIALVGFHLFPNYVSKIIGFEFTQWRLGAVWTPSVSQHVFGMSQAARRTLISSCSTNAPVCKKCSGTVSAESLTACLRQPVGLLQQSWSRRPE